MKVGDLVRIERDWNKNIMIITKVWTDDETDGRGVWYNLDCPGCSAMEHEEDLELVSESR